MSKSSYVSVKFDGGPRAGEEKETAGEPRRHLGHPGSAGHYVFEWDRKDGVRQRTGTYRWEAASGDDLVEPTTGDEASALLEHADGAMTTKSGASISPIPDLTAKAAEPTLEKVHEQVAEIQAELERASQAPSSPDSRPDGERPAPSDGDSATAEAEKGSSKAATSEKAADKATSSRTTVGGKASSTTSK